MVPKTITLEELDFLVNVCAAMLDVDQAATGPSQRKMVAGMYQSQAFIDSRRALLELSRAPRSPVAAH